MNSCKKVRTEMHTLLDSGDRTLSHEARNHMAACEGCRSTWENLCESEDLMHSMAWNAPPPPKDLSDRLMDAVDENAEGAATRARRRKLIFYAAAAVLALMLAGSILWDSEGPSEGSRDPAIPGVAFLGPRSILEPLEGLISEPPAVASARKDFSWLGGTVLSSAGSAARAVAPDFSGADTGLPTEVPTDSSES